MRNSRNPRGKIFAPGRIPWSVSCFSRTSTSTGLGDCRATSAGVTSVTRARAALSSSDFVFMAAILTSSPCPQAHTCTPFDAGGDHPMQQASILRRAGPLMAARLGVAAMTFAIPMVLARVLLPASYGTFKQAWLLSNTLFLVLPLGLTQSLVYFVPRQPEKTSHWVTNALLGTTLLGVLAAALLMTGGRMIAGLF